MRFTCLFCIVLLKINLIQSCTLPSTFDYGTLTVLNAQETANGNAQVEIVCNQGFKAYPSNVLSCEDVANGKASCIKTCPSFKLPGGGVQTNCQYNSTKTSCDNPYAGTTVIFSCDEMFENRNKEQRNVFICQFGYWDYEPTYTCQPVCGRKFIQPSKLIIGGEDTKENEYVWHIAVYYSKNFFNQICGGTIITPKISLSAAHCFSRFKKNGDASKYIVGVGKTYRSYYDSRDNNDAVQYRNLENIILPELYSFESDSRSDYDIAALILEKPFAMTHYVLPACVDQNILFNHDTLSKINGTVVGWGLTEADGKASEHLKMLNVEYAMRTECKLRFDFKRYFYPFVQDKICAGLYKQGKSACKGDSGGGLVFPDSDDRYFVRGIVSIAPKRKRDSCDSNQYTLYTSIAFHLEFINEQIRKYDELIESPEDNEVEERIEPYENGCIIPKIENGQILRRFRGYLPEEVVSFKVGTPVPNNTKLFFTCAAGYAPYPTFYRKIHCTNGEWTKVECRPYCRIDYENFKNMDYECIYNNVKTNCVTPFSGTVMKITCHKNYIYNFDIYTPFTYCIDGYWSIYTFEYCVSACGLDYVDTRKEIQAVDEPTTSDEFPWHAAIYRKNDGQYLCSGALVSDALVLTVISCIENYDPTEIDVIVGKTYLDYNRSDDGKSMEINHIAPVNLLVESFSPTIGALLLKPKDDINGSHVHRVCDGKFDFKYDRPGFFASFEDPYSLEGYSDQLQKIQVIIREPTVCNITRKDGVCIEVVGKPICQRATGGAFIYKDDNNRYQLIALADRTSTNGTQCNLTHLTVGLVL